MSVTLRQEYKSLVRLGFPVLITQLGTIVVSFADTMMVGAYGTDELASAAFVNNLFLVVTVALIGFATGMTPLVGSRYGQNNLEEGGTFWRAGLILNIAVSVIATAAMAVIYFFLPEIAGSDELLHLTQPYYLIVLSTVIPAAIFNCCLQTSNAMTDTAMPMWIMIGGNVLNVCGNYLLIFGKFGLPELGLLGAGIATASARYAMMIAIVVLMLTRKRFSRLKTGLRKKPGKAVYKTTLLTSYPIMIQNGMECILWSLGAVVCIQFGKIEVASYQIVNIIGQLGFMVYLSCSIAVSIRVANYTGVMNIEGIRKAARAGLHIVLIMATIASILFLLFAKQMIGLFTTDSAVIEVAVPMIVPLVLYQYCDASQLNFSNALRGTADVKPLLLVSFVSYLFIGIISLYVFAVALDGRNAGVYYSFALTLLSAAIMLYYFYRRAVRRLQNRLEGA